jgi:ParB-like chromosome segregation protein Spo0J
MSAVFSERQFPITFMGIEMTSVQEICELIKENISLLNLDERVDALNAIREACHEISPFNTEPVDFVKWVKSDSVHANDYNPNSVAPPEMELLRLSISADGYTQPIVSMPVDGAYEVIDGFHRHRVGKECDDIQSRIHGYLPLVQIRDSQHDKNDRMAATIRHNRARGEHRVDSMAEIVVELKRRFWDDKKIAKELGMEPDEVLRLTQVTGLAGLFADREFSEAWESDSVNEVEGKDELL